MKPKKSFYSLHGLKKMYSNCGQNNVYLFKITSSLHKIKKIYGCLFPKARPDYIGDSDRFSYQSKMIPYNTLNSLKNKTHILDIGCGSYPFPYATVVLDLTKEKNHHRSTKLETDGKPLIIGDLNYLPFKDKVMDYICCSHVLEHIDNPLIAYSELIRVGKAGYIETPSLMTDVLFAWAKGMHKWFIIKIGVRLVFFEYDNRLIEGVRNDYWRDSIFSQYFHPLQELFYSNWDIFNNFLMWEDTFEVTIYRQDGSVESSSNQNSLN